MNISNRTVLITGGSSGIGLALAKRFLAKGCVVIITGRDHAKLGAAKRELIGVHALPCDVRDPAQVTALHAQVTRDFPQLDVLINNAGIMRNIKLAAPAPSTDLTEEIDVDLQGPIGMVQQFLPHLKTRPEALIVNVTSGLAFVPFPAAPIYSAAKAGLRAYTRSLRAQLSKSTVRVVELAPPGTDTSLFHTGFENETRGTKPMSLATLADKAMEGIAAGKAEIRPGASQMLYLFSGLAPDFILRKLTKASGY